jgi:hypothetical protein
MRAAKLSGSPDFRRHSARVIKLGLIVRPNASSAAGSAWYSAP